ncbi:MAG TPA: hypothetical protein ACFE0H_14135 [Elainellaceae cyanobacterium]|jgi:hypothetical protein
MSLIYDSTQYFSKPQSTYPAYPAATSCFHTATGEQISSVSPSIVPNVNSRPLQMGDRIQDSMLDGITLDGTKSERTALKSHLDHGSVRVIFCRNHGCPYDSLELWKLQNAILSHNEQMPTAQLIVSPNPKFASPNNKMQPYRSDAEYGRSWQIAQRFGLMQTLPDSLRSAYRRFGIDSFENLEQNTFEVVRPAVYLISPDRLITYAYVDPGYEQPLCPTERLMVRDDEYWLELV